jgi:hypothetical protein
VVRASLIDSCLERVDQPLGIEPARGEAFAGVEASKDALASMLMSPSCFDWTRQWFAINELQPGAKHFAHSQGKPMGVWAGLWHLVLSY